MDLSKEKILVIGLGVSGAAAAKAAKNFGAEVIVSDAKKESELGDAVNELRGAGISVVCGSQMNELLEGVTKIIISPVVPVKIPLIQEAMRRGIEVESEVEFAYHAAKSPILAVTGTNGKTTTTTLLGELMKTRYENTGVGGNIGVPLIDEAIRIGDGGCIVAEISSYQMEATDDFRPKVAGILNVTPDHIVRHGSMEVYQAMKEKIFAQQTKVDFLVLNYDDERTRGMADRAPGNVFFFSRMKILDEGAFVDNGIITIKRSDEKYPLIPVDKLRIKGAHNVENALAAALMAYLGGAEPDKIAEVLEKFPGVEHRIEPVAEIDGVMYYNDSKATNTDAAIKALESFSEPIALIAGGDDKMTDLTDFMNLVKEKCRVLVLVGNAAARFREAAEKIGVENIKDAGYSMEKAVELTRSAAVPGDVALLSPACASFDMYGGFEERGRDFKRIVTEKNNRGN